MPAQPSHHDEPEILIISGSLNPGSKSYVLAGEVAQTIRATGARARLIDLRERPLPICDADEAYNHVAVKEIKQTIQQAATVLLAAPVYNFDVSAAVKNLIELTGSAWEEKIVGFLCAAGGRSSYMSPMSFASSLMLDFRCLIIPRFVYATGGDFESNRLVSSEVRERIQELATRAVDLTRAMAMIPPRI